MFDFMKSRKERHGITVYLIFGTIILVFAFWGVKTVDAPRAGFAAEVNHEMVSVSEFKRAFDRQLQFYSQFMGGQFTPKGEQLVQMKAGVLEQLIGSKLISQAAEASGFKATDVEIRDQIYAIPQFQQNGRFDRSIYNAALEQNRLSPYEFENNLRESARLNLARSVMNSVLRPTDFEAKKLYQLQHTKMSVDFLKINPTDIGVSEADINQYLKSEKGLAQVTEFYNKNKSKYTKAEEVHASHILIKSAPGKEAEAEKKIKEIAEKAKTEDFAGLASKYSEDPGSKSKGGDLGYFSRGRMVEEFENVAFALAPGKMSAPVKSAFGFHLIKVLDKKAGHTQTLEEVKSQIAREQLNEERSTQFYGNLDKILKESNVSELNNLVKNSKLKWENTGLFDLSANSIPKIGPLPEFEDIAGQLTKEKPLATRLIRQGAMAYVVRLKEIQPPKAQPNDKDLDLVSQQVSNLRIGEIFELWQEKLTRSSTIRRNELVLSE